MALTYFGTKGDAQTVKGCGLLLERYGIKPVWAECLPIPTTAVKDLAQIEAGNIVRSAQSLAQARLHNVPFLSTGAGIVTAAIAVPRACIVQLRLYDAERIMPATVGSTLIDAINGIFLEDSETDISAAAEATGAPYFIREGTLLRRVKCQQPVYAVLVATGSATFLEDQRIPPTAVGHISCTKQILKKCSSIVPESDHSVLFPQAKLVMGSGGTGVKLTAAACGADFVALSEVLDRRENPCGPGAEASLFEDAEEGIFCVLAAGSWAHTFLLVCAARAYRGPWDFVSICLWITCHLKGKDVARSLIRFVMLSCLAFLGVFFWHGGEELNRLAYDATFLTIATAPSLPAHITSLND